MSTDDRSHRWRQLLSYQRVGHKTPPEPYEEAHRTDYDKDYDRIVFSSAFRRLHDKTQVFPLSTSDYTRTRLTHSIESSCVGRSLGQLAGQCLLKQGVTGVNPAHLGTIVAAACLAHDIGNPPFGHSGEDAIQQWANKRWPEAGGLPSLFKSDAEWKDVLRFEGNAQGFRILNRLQSRDQRGGLRYTVATIGAMSKYPCPSEGDGWARDKRRVSQKKFGYFQDDAELAEEAFGALGLPRRAPGVYARHPLAFLVEAADDICYAVIDLEDSVELKLIAPEEAYALLEAVAPSRKPHEPGRLERWEWEAKLSRARSRAIGGLVQKCVEVFEEAVPKMEEGEWEMSLVDVRDDVRGPLDAIKKLTREKGYQSERVLEIESAGFKTLGGLLDMFANAVMADRPNKQEKKLRQLLPLEYLQRPERRGSERDALIEALTPYQRLLCVTDYISGMTDGFAVELYQRLSGIKLPT